MSTTVVTSNDKYASIGTLGFHAVLIALLFLVKCPGTGGGGGNDGLGNSGYMSMDVAGLGNNEDGWGPTEEEAQTPVQPTPVTEESSSVTDDTPTNEAPVVNTNKPAKTPTVTKPVTTTTPKPAEPTKEPTKGANLIKGSGSSSGNTNQGTKDGEAGQAGVVSGGGSAGTGGGQGGGTGTGTGTGTGPGSGPGKGGVSSDFSLAGRTMMKKPSLSENFQDNATMVVNVTVDENGKVTKATVDRIKSKYNGETIYVTLAEKAAMTTQFDVSATGANAQRGTITIYFKAK